MHVVVTSKKEGQLHQADTQLVEQDAILSQTVINPGKTASLAFWGRGGRGGGGGGGGAGGALQVPVSGDAASSSRQSDHSRLHDSPLILPYH